MVERLHYYGVHESLPAGAILYSHGQRRIDMFVVLEGEIDVTLPSSDGESKIYVRHHKRNFTGEFNLLTSQASVVDARTVTRCDLLRISRTQFDRLMRAEGDIANVIVAASIWRRIGIVRAGTGGAF
jgi:thioredoxin reductase (NADPH)